MKLSSFSRQKDRSEGTVLHHFALNLLLNLNKAESWSGGQVWPVCLSQLSVQLPHLVAGAAHPEDLMRLHGVHAICHHLVAVGACGGDDAPVAFHFLQLKPEGAQHRHSPQCPPQLGSSSALKVMQPHIWKWMNKKKETYHFQYGSWKRVHCVPDSCRRAGWWHLLWLCLRTQYR